MSTFLLCDPDSLSFDEQKQDIKIIQQLRDFLFDLNRIVDTLPALSISTHLAQPRALTFVHGDQFITCPYKGSSTALLSSFLSAKNLVKQSLKYYYLQYGPLSYRADDVHIIDDTLYLGYGINTDYALLQKFSETLRIQVKPLHIEDSSFRCLMEIFCPIDAGHCLAYLPAFETSSQKLLQEEFHVLSPPYEEVMLGACNAVVIDEHVLLPSGCEITQVLLEQHGYRVSFIESDPKHYARTRNGLGHYLLSTG